MFVANLKQRYLKIEQLQKGAKYYVMMKLSIFAISQKSYTALKHQQPPTEGIMQRINLFHRNRTHTNFKE